MKRFITTLGAIVLALFAGAQQSTLITNVTVHTGTGTVIENGAVGVKDGKITYVGPAAGAGTSYGTTYDGQQGHLYPGFIAPNSTLGLVEIEAVRATRDIEETGTFNPNARALVAYNAESEITPTVVSNGVLMAQITPRGGRVSGLSSVVQLRAWNWEDASYRADDGLHVNWPAPYEFKGWWAEPGGIERSKQYEKDYSELLAFFKQGKAYGQPNESRVNDLRNAALKGVFRGTQTLYVHAGQVRQIREAIQFKKDLGIPRLVIVGGTDSYLVADELRDNNIPVIIERLHSLPVRPEDDVDQPYKLPKQLKSAGVLFCLNNEGDQEQSHVRNLPFLAGTAAAYGLTKEEALQSITLNAAKILGIDKSCGSIEVGKDATLFVSTGDALDMRTNNVVKAWILGRDIDLNTRQKELYNRYKAKYTRP
jgi:imidazolonepropionase-like amidohydrolase